MKTCLGFYLAGLLTISQALAADVAKVEHALGEDVLSITPRGEIKTIRIKTLASPKVSVTEVANELSVKAVAYAPTPTAAAELFVGRSDSFDSSTGELKLGVIESGTYACASIQINGNLTIKGACLKEINATIPAGSQIKIYLNDVVAHGPLDYDDLIKALDKAGPPSDKMALVKKYAAQTNLPTRVLTIAQIKEILGKIPLPGDKKPVCALFSGRVIDPANAAQIADAITFRWDREEAIALLSK